MLYRREIDGLRALAVVPVIMFHSGLGPFHGGFVGVDVFFVISGYLITSLLVEELSMGQFSIVDFYERRARRIMPALFVVLTATSVLAVLWMPPGAFQRFGEGLGAVIIFACNIYFWQKTDYFSPASEENPLLHIWSLAVEEQFYLFFPIILYFAWRFGRSSTIWVFVVLAVVSLLLSVFWTANFPAAGFYLLPARAWELLAGSLCALWLSWAAPRPSAALGLVGLAAIFASTLFFTPATPFPSYTALLPVLGTVCVIVFARDRNLPARTLSFGPLVGIGLLSYSAYLWHHPLFTFARIRSLTAPEAWLFIVLIAVTFLLAFLSWRFVEQPFRGTRGFSNFTRRRIFGLSGVGIVSFLMVGVLAGATDGLPKRFPTYVTEILAGAELEPERDRCFVDHNDNFKEKLAGCLVPAQPSPNLVLYGDSHALALSPALRRVVGMAGGRLLTLAHNGCLPIRGLQRIDHPFNDSCAAFNEASYDLISELSPQAVIVTGRWALALEGTRFDNGEGGGEYGDDEPRVLSSLATAENVPDQIIHSLMELAHRTGRLIVMTQIPEAGWHVPDAHVKQLLWGEGSPSLSTSHARYRERNFFADAIWLKLTDITNISVVNSDEVFCNTAQPGRCMNAVGSNIYYSDDDHVSPLGAKMLADRLMAALPPLTALTQKE
jgi:peptidoglycan/LPS O-acetylase OafA/YrhL